MYVRPNREKQEVGLVVACHKPKAVAAHSHYLMAISACLLLLLHAVCRSVSSLMQVEFSPISPPLLYPLLCFTLLYTNKYNRFGEAEGCSFAHESGEY